jgi:hypothetical protein
MVRNEKREPVCSESQCSGVRERVAIDVIEMQERHYYEVSSRASNTLFRFGRVDAVTE